MPRMIGRLLTFSAFFVFLAGCGTVEDPAALTTASSHNQVTLYAAQHIDAGHVLVDANGDLEFVTNEFWKLVETHVAVSSDDAAINVEWTEHGWLNRSGNPTPGRFPYSAEHEPPLDQYTVDIDSPGISYGDYVAAHAVVIEVLEAGPYPADEVLAYSQGVRKNGTPVGSERSEPDKALEKGPISGANDFFFSLGFPSQDVDETFIEMGFTCPVTNGEGADLKVWEVTQGTSYDEERAEIFAWDEEDQGWVSLGFADNSDPGPAGTPDVLTVSEFDLDAADLDQTTRIRIVDSTDPTPHNAVADAFDIDGVEALHDCVGEQTETAWATGTRFVDRGNWATYFQHDTAPPIQ